MQALFPDNYLAGVSQLKLVVKAAPPRALTGTHLGRAPGSSVEFRDYQQYTPGDDLRRVDWNVYSRTRHLFVRRFERPTAIPVVVLVDASASMLLQETPQTKTRYATAARIAAAIISASVSAQNPVYLIIASGDAPAFSHVLRGRRGLVRSLAELAAQHKPGPTSLASSVRTLLPLLASKGQAVVAIISDFFDDHGIDAVIDSLRPVPGRLALLRVTQPWDAEPDLTGDWELADCETGATVPLSPDADVLERYRAAYTSYFTALENYTLVRGAKYLTFDAASDTLNQLGALFPAGVLTM